MPRRPGPRGPEQPLPRLRPEPLFLISNPLGSLSVGWTLRAATKFPEAGFLIPFLRPPSCHSYSKSAARAAPTTTLREPTPESRTTLSPSTSTTVLAPSEGIVQVAFAYAPGDRTSTRAQGHYS